MSEEAAVRKWVENTGYPFELAIGESLRSAGWEVEHARWFEDPTEEKWRELDVFGSVHTANDLGDTHANLNLAIECKVSSDKPWVLFAAPTTTAGALRFWHWGTVDELSRQIAFVASVNKVDPPYSLGLKEEQCHGVVKAFGDNKTGDPTGPFSAARSVIGAVAAIGAESAVFFDRARDSHAFLQFNVPVLVLDGSLYVYRYDSEEGQRLRSTETAVLAMASPFDGQPVLVRVVTKAGWSDFVARATADGRRFASAMVELGNDVRAMRMGREMAEPKRAASGEASNGR